MTDGGYLAADPDRQARMAQFGRALSGWAQAEKLLPTQAAHRLGLTREYMGDAIGGRMDPLLVAPSTAMRIIQRTALTAAYLGFEDPAGAESASEPLPAGDVPAADPQAVAGTPIPGSRPGPNVQAYYVVPGMVGFEIDWDGGTRTTFALTIDMAEQASAALAEAAEAARRAHAKAALEI